MIETPSHDAEEDEIVSDAIRERRLIPQALLALAVVVVVVVVRELLLR
ncbi:hypothetical protein [Microbacterium oxydans]|jgi:hypothetical protein|nr:hypothetical protein [Microbacterium oxydans]AZS46404.1 hypothetical protein CVS53_01076 [Microbacterium oxydans]